MALARHGYWNGQAEGLSYHEYKHRIQHHTIDPVPDGEGWCQSVPRTNELGVEDEIVNIKP